MQAMKKSPAKRASSPQKSPAKKPNSAVKRTVAGAKRARQRARAKGNAKRSTKKPAARPMASRRADFGAPIDGFFAKQSPQLRPILEALRKLVEDAAPDAAASIKWGMPFYSVGGRMMCALAGHKSHVNLILAGPPGTFDDPEGRLQGEGKTGRRLTLRSLDELPRQAVRGWVRRASQAARG
jgi:hypothetical protein